MIEYVISIPWEVFDKIYREVIAFGLSEKVFLWKPGDNRGEGGDFPSLHGLVLQRIPPTKDEMLGFGPPMLRRKIVSWFDSLTTKQNKELEETFLAAVARRDKQSDQPQQPPPVASPEPDGPRGVVCMLITQDRHILAEGADFSLPAIDECLGELRFNQGERARRRMVMNFINREVRGNLKSVINFEQADEMVCRMMVEQRCSVQTISFGYGEDKRP